MTASQIIEEQYRNREIDACIRSRFPADLVDDVKQDLFEILMGKPAAEIEQIHARGQMRFYIVRIILNLSRQERNVVFKNYRPAGMMCMPVMDSDHGEDHDPVLTEEQARRIAAFDKERQDAIAKLHWYEREVFTLWVEMGSLQKVADFTDINYNSLKKTVREARKKVKQFMEEI